jgi:hypothetical protein
MSTICTCKNSGVKTGFACNYSEGCPFVDPKEKAFNKAALSFDEKAEYVERVSNLVEGMKTNYDNKVIDCKESGTIRPDRSKKMAADIRSSMGEYIHSELIRAKLITPNGDVFNVRYDQARAAIEVIKVNDFGGTEVISINPGSANQIFIK